jgi:uncharacterized membrane protein HdeD (DUF308 family)
VHVQRRDNTSSKQQPDFSRMYRGQLSAGKERNAMRSIANAITDTWWLFALEGVLAIGFGIIAWVWPDLTVLALVVMFAAFAISTGVANLFAANDARQAGQSPWGFIFDGILGIATGVVVAIWPDISSLALMYVIAAWAIVTGIFKIATAIELRKVIDNEWFLALGGIASIVFGVLAAIFPGDGALALVWAIGLYSIVYGGFLIGLGFRLHQAGRQLTSAA